MLRVKHFRRKKALEKQQGIASAFRMDASKSFLLKVLGTAIVYFTHIILAQMLGQSEFGVFAFILVFTTVIAQLSTLGFNESTKRFLPHYLTRKETALARGFLTFSTRITLVASITTALIFAGLFKLADSKGWYTDIPAAVFLSMLVIPILTWTHLKESIAISRSFLARGLAPTFLVRPLLILLIVACISIATGKADAYTATQALLLASFFVGILQTVLVSKAIEGELANNSTQNISYQNKKRKWFRSSLPLFIANGFFTLAINIDVLIVGFFLDDKSVAVYFAAVKTVSLLAFIQQAISSVVTRRFSEANAQSDRNTFLHFFRVSAIAATVLSVLGGLFLLLFGESILGVFGEGFEAGYVLMQILVVGVVLQALTCSSQEALLVTGQQRTIAIIHMTGFVTNIAASIILLQFYGLIGIAIATAVVTILRAFVTYWIASKTTGIKLF